MEETTNKAHWQEELLIRVDTRLQSMEEGQQAILEQVKYTNGRVLDLEKKNIKYETQLGFIKVILMVLFAPVFVSLTIWGIQSFIATALL